MIPQIVIVPLPCQASHGYLRAGSARARRRLLAPTPRRRVECRWASERTPLSGRSDAPPAGAKLRTKSLARTYMEGWRTGDKVFGVVFINQVGSPKYLNEMKGGHYEIRVVESVGPGSIHSSIQQSTVCNC
jgi:hypothetical protein